jgi:hypothetical protein
MNPLFVIFTVFCHFRLDQRFSKTVQAKEYAMHTGIQLRSDTLIIPQNTGIFAALQQSENGSRQLNIFHLH